MTAPFTLLAEAVRQHGSPLWAYDASTIAERVEQLNVFDTVRFAQKANPNLHMLRLMRAQGDLRGERQYAEILRSRFPNSPEAALLRRGAFDE